MKFSTEQLAAIESTGENLLVSASAGSGKTTVMIARVLEKITKERVSLDNMLICTFTKKSAADMRLKLQKELTVKKNETNNPIYGEQLDALQRADISTISSWCQKIVKTYFYEIDVDPAFEVVDESEGSVMLAASIEKAIADEMEKGDIAFARLYDSMYEKRNDNKLRSIIKKVYEFAVTQTDAEKWLNECLRKYDGSYQNDRNAIAKKRQKSVLKELNDLLVGACDDKFSKSIEMLIDCAESYTKPDKTKRMSYGKCSAEEKAAGKGLREKVIKLADFYARTDGGEIDRSHAEVVVRLTGLAMKYYREEKEKKAKLDFSDLEHYAYEILQKQEPLADVKEKYKYVFVDEFQDINPLQQGILRLLQGEGNMFLVGDLKQSIYAFRNCDPSIFADMYANYGDYGYVKPIDFLTNYRCASEIIDFVNGTFNPLMTEDVGAVNYSKCNLKGKPNNEKGEVKVKIFRPKTEKDAIFEDYDISSPLVPDKDTDKIGYEIACDILEKLECSCRAKLTEARERLAKASGQEREDLEKEVAKIEKDLEGKQFDFESAVVLVRKRGTTAYAVYNALKALGAPVHLACDACYSDAPYIRFLVEFLRCLDCEQDEIAFASVCSSELFAVSNDELAQIAHLTREKDVNFVEKARTYANNNNNELAEKIGRVFEFCDKYYQISLYCTVGELLGKMIAETDYFNRVLCAYGGEGARRLSEFLDLVGESIYSDTVHNFVKFIADGGDEYEKVPLGGCINIMTVHSSKGLEFPYVFLVGCNEKNSNTDINVLRMHREHGLALKTLNEEEKRFDENPLFVICDSLKKSEEYEESMRLLYVALTRAQHGLYLYAKVEVTQNSFYDGNPSTNANFFGMLSSQLIEHGYDVVDLEDVEIELVQKPKTIFAYRDEDANLVSILKKSFEDIPKFSSENLKTSVTAIAVESAIDLSAEVVDEERSAVEYSGGDDFALRRGNAFHKVMEMLDFELDFDEAFVDAVKWVVDYEITQEDKLKIEKAFYKMREVAKSNKLYREKSFIYNANGRLVQGIIDLLAVGNDGAIVIDYKTTSASHLASKEYLVQYRTQVDIYSKAVSEIANIPVKAVMLYAFEINDFIKL